MLCPNQGCEAEMIATIEKFSQRINSQLIRVGFWECPECEFVKGIFEKNLEREDRIIKSVQCHCCNDTGQIDNFCVRKYIFPDYLVIDPPVPCKRCRKGMEISNGWDIATREDCDRIHRIQIAGAIENKDLQVKVREKIACLNDQKSMSKGKK